MSYCEYIKTTTGWAIDLNKTYHDEKYGFPIEDDNELFGRLLLEINQAGLSWSTILKKETAFRTAYDNFNIETIANYTETDEARLLADPGIIRNRLKVKAAIHNAQAIIELKNEPQLISPVIGQCLASKSCHFHSVYDNGSGIYGV